MPSLPLRIAILECDTPLPKTLAQYGGYGGVFTSLLHTAADTLSATPTPIGRLPCPTSFSRSDVHLSTFDVVNKQEYPNLNDIDAIIMTGSKHTAYHDDPWILSLVDFVRGILDAGRVRVIGACFGHQIVGRAVGGVVKRNAEGWEVSVTAVDLTKTGQEIFGRTGLAIHQMHLDIVATLPPDSAIEVLGSTSKCGIQGMYVPRKLLTVQGHPEFNEEIVTEILDVRKDAGILNAEQCADALQRANRHQDGVLIAQAWLRFLLED